MTGNVAGQFLPPLFSLVEPVNFNSFDADCMGKELKAMLNVSLASAVWTANRLIFVPFSIGRPTLVSQFYWMNGATAAGNTDVGIYTEDGTIKLGSSGSTANAGTSVLQAVNVADFTLAANQRYWLALGCDDSTHTYFRVAPSAFLQEFIGYKEQLSGWSSGLPASITIGLPTVAVVPHFGFTGKGVI